MEEHTAQSGEEFIPSLEEIRQTCLEIQAEWTIEQEMDRRFGCPWDSENDRRHRRRHNGRQRVHRLKAPRR